MITCFPDGVYTVLVTPFTYENTIDYESLKHLLEIQYKSDVIGFVLMGTTSEVPTLSTNEKIFLIKWVTDFNKAQQNKKFIVVGVGGNNTANVLEFSDKINGMADGLMVTVPYYNKPQQGGIAEHFKVIANQFSDKPIMIYNIPGRTGIDMLPETMIDVINYCPNVMALKEASGKFDNVSKFINLLKTYTTRNLKNNFKIFSGDDINTHHYCNKYNARGVISVASNVIPHEICNILNMSMKQNGSSYYNIHILKEFIKYLFIESNPVPIKDILFQIGVLNTRNVRLPLIPIADESKRQILGELLHKLRNHSSKIVQV